MAAYPDSPNDYVETSYRALRLSIVVLVLTLGASLAIELLRTGCLQGSISSYYYTPVHAVFVGSLVAIGVVMIALKGRDAVEDMLFNVAGVLAPIVALVPTRRPTGPVDTAAGLCGLPADHVDVPVRSLVVNSVPALAIGAAVALVITYAIARHQRQIASRPNLPRATQVGLAVCAVLLGAGLAWYFGWNDSFHRHAHGGTAVAMFVFIWLAVIVNAGWPRGLLVQLYRWLDTPIPANLEQPTPRHRRYRRWYRAIAVAMPAAAGLVLLVVPGDVRIFWLEVVEIVPFAMFWAVQTFEAWTTGVTTTAPAT